MSIAEHLNILHNLVAFIPPLLAFSRLNECRAKLTDIVPEEDYLNRIRVISGSLFLASVCLTLLGATGLIGVISKRIGPLTVAPLVILLCKSNPGNLMFAYFRYWERSSGD